MFGINKKVTFQKIEDNGFDRPKVLYENIIACRVQKNKKTTRTQSNAYEFGSTTAYFITMDFLDYAKGDRLIHKDDKYTIVEITEQENFNDDLLYVRLDVAYNA